MTTWAEFKRAIEREGVTDDMEIDWIDVGCACDKPIVEVSPWEDGSKTFNVTDI